MNKPEFVLLIVVLYFHAIKNTPNYNIHRTENVTVNVSRYIWNITVMYLDTFINNVSRYVTVSIYIWNVTVTYLDTFEMYLIQV